jgi:hypothetical protein
VDVSVEPPPKFQSTYDNEPLVELVNEKLFVEKHWVEELTEMVVAGIALT